MPEPFQFIRLKLWKNKLNVAIQSSFCERETINNSCYTWKAVEQKSPAPVLSFFLFLSFSLGCKMVQLGASFARTLISGTERPGRNGDGHHTVMRSARGMAGH